MRSTVITPERAQTGADVQPSASERERARAFEAERKGDVWGPEGNYWRRRKPCLDELDAVRPVDLADEPPPGWGHS